MSTKDDEEQLLRSVAEQNAQSINLARRRSEEALRKQSDWLRVTLSSIGDGVISTDVEGRVTFMNRVAEFLTGWDEAEALGRSLTEIFQILNEESRRPVENPALRALSSVTIVGLANHTILIAKDGTEWPIDDSAAPIRSEQGEVLGAVLQRCPDSERTR
jgi:PAS domain S-box-containing protein